MEQGELLLLLALRLVLTALPGIAAVLYAARRGVRREPVLLAIGLAATGVVAMASFWLYYLDRVAGESWSFLVPLGSIALAGWSLWGGEIDRGLLRRLAVPLGLWGLGSGFVVFLGFAHGGIDAPVATSAGRFYAYPLPGDNLIPQFFAEWFYFNGHHGTPPVFPGEWLASDRPPLQVGYVLSQRPILWDSRGLGYQLLGVVLQQLWIVGLWALMVAARVGRLTRFLVAIAVLLSPLAIVNGFFVWPKLLPAAMLLAAAALLITPEWNRLRRSGWGAALFAALLGLAMLGHGSSAFAIVALLLVAIFRGLPSWRWIGVAAMVGVLFLAPWSAYQKYGDPPGNRLAKWMLAGVVEVDSRGAAEAIADSYRDAGLSAAIHHKAENFVTMAGGGPAVEFLHAAADDIGEGEVAEADRALRTLLFLYPLPSMGLLVLAPLAMAFLRRRGRMRPAEWRFALSCFGVVAIACLFWGLLIYGDAATRTVLHLGSYLAPILAIAGAVAGLRATLPRFAVFWVALNVVLMLVIYVPVLESPPGSSYSPLGLVLAALSLIGYGSLALRGPRPDPREPGSGPTDEVRLRRPRPDQAVGVES